MDKEEDVYMYTHAHTMEYYSAIKKSENAICSNMDGPRDYHAEWRETEIVNDIPNMRNLKRNDTNEHIYK